MQHSEAGADVADERCVVRKDLAKLRHFMIVGPYCVSFLAVLNSPSGLMKVIREKY
jgi:hypothetical protein